MTYAHTHSHRDRTPAALPSHTLKLSPPLPAKPLPREYLGNLRGSGIFWRRQGCYETLGRVTETDKYFFSPEAEKQGGGVWYLFVIHGVNHMEPLQTAWCSYLFIYFF